MHGKAKTAEKEENEASRVCGMRMDVVVEDDEGKNGRKPVVSDVSVFI